ncbi:MAG: hypothetical protein LUC22_03865, partial [Prevotella sp.]|nr:hypothetical protein [Prevotella sp.]
MRRLAFLILLIAFSAAPIYARSDADKAAKKTVKTLLATARTNIKNGTNLDDAEQSMRSLLADSAYAGNEKIWLTLFEAIKKRQEQLNENLYLQQDADTAAFFSNTIHLFDVLESLDTIDAKPGADGVSRPRYRSKHAAYLSPYRRNLYGGGGFFLNKKDYEAAYKCFDRFADCRLQPLFSGYEFDGGQMSEAAFRATYCGYKLRRADLIDKYSDLALRDTANAMYVLQYVAQACLISADTAAYLQTLVTGFERYPDSPY